MKGQAAALMYHAVGAVPATAEQVERDLTVAPEEFAWQMADLAARGFRTLTLDEYFAALDKGDAGERTILLTFDDAYADVDEVVTPVLRRHGFTAVMFAPFEHLGGKNSWDADHKHLATLGIASAEQLRAMASGPWEIASHSMRHVDHTSLTPDRCRQDFVESRERLCALIGRPVLDLAYPFGRENPEVRIAARAAGYRMAFTAGRTPIGDRFALDRRPIQGPDSRAMFRVKTSRSAGLFYGVADLAPAWARSAARRLTASVPAGRA